MNRALLLTSLLASAPALAADYEICVKINVQTTDSGQTANGIAEDYWQGANGGSSYLVPGYGLRVKLSRGGWAQNYDADPHTGCFVAALGTPTGLGVRVYAYSTDEDGNVIRVHDAGTATDSWYPGSSLSQGWSNQTLRPDRPNGYVVDGRADDRWTTMGVAAFSLYRYHDGLNGATISLGFAENDCNNSGSTHGSATQYIASDRAHLIRIGRCASTASDSREKMIISHEVGHAVMRLNYGQDGDDAPRSQTFAVNPAPTNPSCTNVSSYSMTSLEFNSQTFKEAFADLYSARVWNIREARGTYTYRGVAFDLETWDNVGGTFQTGGFVANACNASIAGVSTKGDWLRFLWDLNTATCPEQPTFADMLAIYKAVRDNNDSGVLPLSVSNYDDAILYAIDQAGLSACERARAADYAVWNGL